MSRFETIGIAGVGDLGAQMAVQAAAFYPVVRGFDIVPRPIAPDATGIDKLMTQARAINPMEWVDDLDKLLDTSSIIHVTGRTKETAADITHLPEDSLLVLHSSAMSESLEEAKRLRGLPKVAGEIAIVHCTMNDLRTVSVADDLGPTDRIQQHLLELRLNPVVTNTDAEDRLAARSQGLAALIHQVVQGPTGSLLAIDAAAGLLTPSGNDVHELVQRRELNWTAGTRASLLRNPHLLPLIDRMRRIVEEAQGIQHE